MTSRLSERLDRLERARTSRSTGASLPPEIAGAYLTAMAIALGGFPQAQGPSLGRDQDSLSDGLARGLGYRDHDDMEARGEADPEDWRRRMQVADATMAARYVTMGNTTTPEDAAFQVMVGALDEIGRAKAGSPDWPAEHPSLDTKACSIRQAFAVMGVAPDQVGATLA